MLHRPDYGTKDLRVELIDHMGSDLTVVNAARVSFDKESDWIDKDEKKLSDRDENLIRYLAKHKHMSPFGHCFATFRITAPVFVARQLMRHEYLRPNEVSRRYVDTTPEFFKPETWRSRPDKSIKQGSGAPVSRKNQAIADSQYQLALSSCIAAYERLLAIGVAPEQARMVLPQSMLTTWYWSGSMDAFAEMCSERMKPNAQEETRKVAEGISHFMEHLYPVSWGALMETL